MARRNNPDATAPPGQPPEENPARAAFDEWKRQAEAAQGGNVGGGADLYGGQPFMPPPPYAMPGWGYPPPPQPPPMAQPPPAPFAAAEQEVPASDRTSSLVEGLGSLIRLGIEVLNAGLAGGLQMVEGVTYPGGYGSAHYDYGPYPYADDCGCYGHHDGYHHHHAHCDCNPSVHNCG